MLRLFDLAVTSSAVYTRYSDDVVFSRVHACRDDLTRLLGRVNAVVGRHGFDLHRRKTRIVPPGARHIVLGLQVDRDQCRLTRRTRLRIDSHIYGVQKFGLAAHQVHRGFSSVAGLLNHVEGLLRYARDIEPAWTGERLDRWRCCLRQGRRTSFELVAGRTERSASEVVSALCCCGDYGPVRAEKSFGISSATFVPGSVKRLRLSDAVEPQFRWRWLTSDRFRRRFGIR